MLYNSLVDIYEYYTEKHKKLEAQADKTMKFERSFTDKIKGVAKKGAFIKTIQENADFVSMYNNMVDLFNHYVKKMELKKSIEEL